MDVAVTVDPDLVAGMDDHGRAGVLHDGRTVEFHARLQLRAVIDAGGVDAFERVVDASLALERCRGGVPVPGAGAPLTGQLADLGGGDEVDAHHLNRPRRGGRVFALIGLVEGGLDSGKARIGDLAFIEQHLGGVLLVLVAKLAVAQKLDVGGRDVLGGELLAGAFLGLGEEGLSMPAAAPFFRSASRVTKIVAAQVRHHHAPGREDAGTGRHHDLLDRRVRPPAPRHAFIVVTGRTRRRGQMDGG